MASEWQSKCQYKWKMNKCASGLCEKAVDPYRVCKNAPPVTQKEWIRYLRRPARPDHWGRLFVGSITLGFIGGGLMLSGNPLAGFTFNHSVKLKTDGETNVNHRMMQANGNGYWQSGVIKHEIVNHIKTDDTKK